MQAVSFGKMSFVFFPWPVSWLGAVFTCSPSVGSMLQGIRLLINLEWVWGVERECGCEGKIGVGVGVGECRNRDGCV